VPSAISTVGLYFSYESPKFLLSVGREEEAMKVLKTMFVVNNNKSVEEYPVSNTFFVFIVSCGVRDKIKE
jgi:MFS transporter, VNT family, synaptic vesicle glycoprotein 2